MTVNKDYIAKYLVDQPTTHKETAYLNIHRLEAGEYLLIKNNHISVQSYYEFNFTPISYKSEYEYIEHFRDLFKNSVKDRLRSHKPIGIPLSGGLDSSSIVSMSAEILKDKKSLIRCYSVVFEKYSEADERSFISSVLDKYNLDGVNLLGDDCWNFKGQFKQLGELDEPFPLFNQSLASLIPENANSDNINVLLSGHCGDHVLLGNLNFLSYLLKKGKLYQLINQYFSWKTKKSFSELFLHTFMPHFQFTSNVVYPWLNYNYFFNIDITETTESLVRNINWDYNQTKDYFTRIIKQNGHVWFDQYLYNHYKVEKRYPFLDRKLLEFLASIPVQLKIKPNQKKYILRKAMAGINPQKINNRISKGSHLSLVNKGIKKEWAQIRQYYSCPMLSSLGLVNPDVIKEWFEKWYMGYKHDFAHINGLMRVLSLEIWLQSKIS